MYDHADGSYRIAYDSRDYYYQGASPISYDTFLERVMARVEGDTVTQGDTLRAEVTPHRSADTNSFTRNP